MEALAAEGWHQEVVALVRCGLSRTEAMSMDALERAAHLLEHSRQERAAYDRAEAEARRQ